ncbi:MAG: hypothetical protein Q7S58_15365 [Candidatus Binatus sp.]|uniref:hypothetical protein n=1 Tax=Candidatus Binatus sp. TaxID=2811406 RepID=UPI00271CC14F|nr:hypothetical protein [Candidatus Binatus sp.]MDO8433780.1 hypothetical protein [Candidatus Binatus sp.]
MRAKDLIAGFRRGAIQLRFLDVLTAVILTGILLYVASLQFATYNRAPQPVGSSAAPAKSP